MLNILSYSTLELATENAKMQDINIVAELKQYYKFTGKRFSFLKNSTDFFTEACPQNVS